MQVWLAEWTNCAVAVKELLAFSGMASGEYDPREYAALFNEVQLLGSLSHPSVMRFLAVCVEPPMIVMQVGLCVVLFDWQCAELDFDWQCAAQVCVV